MYSEDDLEQAIASGALSNEAAESLRAFVAARRKTPAPDEEHFRLITGFNDVFVVVAAGLLLTSVSWIGESFAKWFGFALVAVTAWILSEFFVRQRRMALPAIVLLLAFVGGCAFAAFHAVGPGPEGLLGGAVAGGAAAWLHWRRFRVPITIAAGVGAVSIGSVAALLATNPQFVNWVLALMFACGLLTFALALKWDASDRQRETRRSDVAFWLHLLAAPLLVHPIFYALGIQRGTVDPLSVILVLLVYVAIALLSLWIDRRALMVSALGYVLFAFTQLFTQSGGSIGPALAPTALVLGSALLLLSAFWQKSRSFALRLMPLRLQRLVPP